MLSCIVETDETSPTKSEETSPMTGIIRGLMNSALSSQNCSKCHGMETEENRRGDSSDARHSSRVKRSRSTDRGLFKDAFKFKNTPESSVKSGPKARRLLGTAFRHLPRTEPVSPSAEKENNSSGCSPRGNSPQKMPGLGKRCRYPLEDCDPNSQDSGYEASYLEKEEKSREVFRFLEPMAVAPRRTSIECRSPVESPVRSSPQRIRAVRSSLFRTVSSGYESMDDGFNDLIDAEPLEDASRHSLPEDISSLLCGDIIMGIGDPLSDSPSAAKMESNSPSTPEFPRTNRTDNFRRSISLQTEKPETRKNSSLSKVRSCLFRSPNAASSTTELTCDSHRSAAACSTYSIASPIAATTTSTMMVTVPAAHRRRIDYADENTSIGDFESSPTVRTFKRPDPPIDDSPKLVKKSRTSGSSIFDAIRHCRSIDASPSGARFGGIPFQRSLSDASATITVIEPVATKADDKIEIETAAETETENHALIESAIHRSTTDNDLTGDFSKPCVLPLAVGHHEDLKSISTETLAALIRGDFNDRIGSFTIVDCRYPYEFDAGHIQGALNLYSKDLIERSLLEPLTNAPKIQPDTNKRNILVFHCEFSWERGPNLSRFLRSLDRRRNKEHYPALHYPEVYLLHGGYEQFYREHKGLCLPQGYRPMRHPDHEADLKQFRSKSKSWHGEKSRITGFTTRTNLRRLGF
ncbi:uncharacterized protein LOC116433465 isoform X2 [Nomia melanderi]